MLSIGVIGIAYLVYLSGVQVCEPSSFQAATVRIVLSLCSALIATVITGRVIVNAPIPGVVNIRAGGAIAIFVLVFIVNPLKLSEAKMDASFSNETCHGKLPPGKNVNGKEIIKKDSLPENLNPDTNQLSPADALGRPVRFNFYYQFDPYPGTRNWVQVQRGIWIEMYPNPEITTIFREIGRETVDGCPGTIVTQIKTQLFKVFIPDLGCKMMWLRFQYDDIQWRWLGHMNDVT
ncbi:hypothetical protein [Pantoea sp. AS-PWVM4]|uniref:hypothetical protein n=1 Tax=Pantoea sp. AS-PWVM4 TaxID=1332069 RepID=UPI000568608F|nr:hypothetical protein [Pantoea sp. AS-PWVM4]